MDITLTIEVDQSDARYFKRRFLGFCGTREIRSEQETVRLLQEIYPEDNYPTAQDSLQNMIGKEIQYSRNKCFILKKFENRKNILYMMETYSKK